MAESFVPPNQPRPPAFGTNGTAGRMPAMPGAMPQQNAPAAGATPSAMPTQNVPSQNSPMQNAQVNESRQAVKKKPMQDVHIDELLDQLIELNGTDLHISQDVPPTVRVNGELSPLPYENVAPLDVQQMMYGILTDEQIQRFESSWELDFAYALQKRARFRVNLYKDKGSVATAMRLIPFKVPTMESLGLPPIIEKLTHVRRGLILVTGPTGSGKSTTLASMLKHINDSRAEHILTIEDPIEYVHPPNLSIVHQRELGQDTKSFANALRAALREDPDIILVGEMRDLETISLAVSAAETGHLVFGTLHTNSAATSVDRIVDSFPSGDKDQIRLQLSNNLQAIISQMLVPTTPSYKAQTGKGRIASQEIMIASSAIRNLIREAKAHQITSIIQTSGNAGMITADRNLTNFYQEGKISHETALSRAHNQEEIKRMLAGVDDANKPGASANGRPAGR